MKKLLGIIFVSLLLGGNAYAKKITNLECKNTKHDYSYLLVVNLDEKSMKLYEYNEMEITDISDATILAENNSHGMNRFLLFNRYTGELNHTIKYAYDNKLHSTGTYICKKVDKIL